MSELSRKQKQRLLPSHMFVVLKWTGKAKARLVAGGNVQRNFMSKEETSSPTAATEAVLLTSIVDATEERDVAIVDIPNAFIQMRVENKQDRVILQISGKVVEWLVTIAPDVYKEYVVLGKRDIPHLLVECHNTIYGTMVAGQLYYRKFTGSLEWWGFVMNPYNPCVWNKVIKGKQCPIVFHVDDSKISHVNPKVVDYTID